MELRKYILFKMNNMNCEFRILYSTDISQNYLNGLKDQKKYIQNIPTHVSIPSQRKYINNILYSKGDIICGLFINDNLVGTAGVQSSKTFLLSNEVTAEYVATIGIFLFNKKYRGLGLGKTLVWAATYLYQNSIQVEWFGAGMAKENIPSLKSFLSCGFREIYEDEKNIRVLLYYSELKKPEFIKEELICEVDQHAKYGLVKKQT